MILKTMFRLNPKGSMDNYLKVLKTKRIYFIGLFFISLGIIGVSFLLKVGSSIRSFSSGMGFGFLSVSILFILQNEWILRSKDRLKRKRLEEIDERNQNVSLQAMALAGRVMVFVLAVLTFIFGFIDPKISMYLSGIIGLTGFLYFCFYHYLNKKM